MWSKAIWINLISKKKKTNAFRALELTVFDLNIVYRKNTFRCIWISLNFWEYFVYEFNDKLADFFNEFVPCTVNCLPFISAPNISLIRSNVFFVDSNTSFFSCFFFFWFAFFTWFMILFCRLMCAQRYFTDLTLFLCTSIYIYSTWHVLFMRKNLVRTPREKKARIIVAPFLAV